jgi:hypothetical protein
MGSFNILNFELLAPKTCEGQFWILNFDPSVAGARISFKKTRKASNSEFRSPKILIYNQF